MRDKMTALGARCKRGIISICRRYLIDLTELFRKGWKKRLYNQVLPREVLTEGAYERSEPVGPGQCKSARSCPEQVSGVGYFPKTT